MTTFESHKNYKIKKYKLISDNDFNNLIREAGRVISFPISSNNNKNNVKLNIKLHEKYNLYKFKGGAEVEPKVEENTNPPLPKNTSDNKRNINSSYEFTTIESNTYLYHGSDKIMTITKNDIQLTPWDDTSLVGLFTTDESVAKSQVKDCRAYPNMGAVHKFQVSTTIDKILVLNEREKQWDTIKKIENEFCGITRLSMRLNGVYFKQSGDYMLCDPNSFLEFISTERCTGHGVFTPV
jgi:hypothetical protein